MVADQYRGIVGVKHATMAEDKKPEKNNEERSTIWKANTSN